MPFAKPILQLIAVTVFILGGSVAIHYYDKHIAEDAVAKVSAARLEAERKSLQDSLVVAKKQFRVDTIYATKTERAYVTIHDSALAHITDTVLVRQTIERADTAIKACKAVVFDCAATNRILTAQLAVSDSATDALKHLIPTKTQRLITATKWTGVGVLLGYLVHAVVR